MYVSERTADNQKSCPRNHLDLLDKTSRPNFRAPVFICGEAQDSGEIESGCMFMAPGTHRTHLPHEDTFAEDNMLTRGQRIVEGIDEAATVAAPLRPGEMSLHNVRIAHASGPNRTADRRIGVAFRYIAAGRLRLTPVEALLDHTAKEFKEGRTTWRDGRSRYSGRPRRSRSP